MRILVIFLFMINVFAEDLNNSNDLNISNDLNNSDLNKSEMESSIFSLDLPQEIEENINDVIENDDYNMEIAIILDKSKFFQFIPNILNSINAYMIKKDINYHIKLFDKEKNITKELDKITPDYKYIFTFFTNSDELKYLEKYTDNYFFVPTLNKTQASNIDAKNIFFGGINYHNQVLKLNQYITGYTNIIYENNDLSKYITTVIDEMLLQPHKIYKYPIKYTNKYNDTFVYLNTKAVNTAQILANFTYNKIETKSIFSTQINYTPLLFSLTSKEDVKNLILANSIFNISPIIEDNNLNLGSDINFNWLNYTTSTLLNVAYSIEIDENIYFLNDFNLYMFFNQVDYKTNLYKIFQNGFIKIEN